MQNVCTVKLYKRWSKNVCTVKLYKMIQKCISYKKKYKWLCKMYVQLNYIIDDPKMYKL